jgi:hypothetical protein
MESPDYHNFIYLVSRWGVNDVLAKHDQGPKDHNDTIADEVASYVFAFLGFYFQYTHMFSAPFPLNILLSPVQFTEYWIRWALAD